MHLGRHGATGSHAHRTDRSDRCNSARRVIGEGLGEAAQDSAPSGDLARAALDALAGGSCTQNALFSPAPPSEYRPGDSVRITWLAVVTLIALHLAKQAT